MFFGSGFILKESLMSTSFPHYHMYSANQQRYAQQDVVVSLIQENEAEKQQKMMDCIQDIFGENSSYWLPVFEIDTLYNDVLFKCSPYYCSVGKYLEEKKSFNLVEAQHLTVFVLMISLKLEEMHLGYPEKFSFDYVFFKDEKKGITFDNLVLGGYHAISFLLEPSKQPVLHSIYYDFMDALLKVIEFRCAQPFHFHVWALPLIHMKGHLTTIDEYHAILEMISMDLHLFPILH
ncbi:hypothetical protein HMI56_004493 [Coelomomyces lativittatus]|nr:hypothetical protein HMI56_004493 [Coelomomyces lativittatus]